MKLNDIRVRGLVLGILRAYANPCLDSQEQIETILPVLRTAPRPKVRELAGHISGMFLGLQGRCPCCYKKLLDYRLRHLDRAIEELDRITKPKRKRA